MTEGTRLRELDPTAFDGGVGSSLPAIRRLFLRPQAHRTKQHQPDSA
jgi:hypothetical protein